MLLLHERGTYIVKKRMSELKLRAIEQDGQSMDLKYLDTIWGKTKSKRLHPKDNYGCNREGCESVNHK
jgi:hypothetical protein